MHKTVICITRGSRVPESRFSPETPSQTRPTPPGDAQKETTPPELYPEPATLVARSGSGVPAAESAQTHANFHEKPPIYRFVPGNHTRPPICYLRFAICYSLQLRLLPSVVRLVLTPPPPTLGFGNWDFLGHCGLGIGPFPRQFPPKTPDLSLYTPFQPHPLTPNQKHL